MNINEGQRAAGGQLQNSASLVDGIIISNHMAKHRNAVSVFGRLPNVASACNAGGSSSLHTRMNAAARLMQPLRCAAPQNQQPFPASRVKHTAHASTGTTSAAHITARHAAPALSSRDPASHAPSPSQPSPTSGGCTPYAYGQAL